MSFYPPSPGSEFYGRGSSDWHAHRQQIELNIDRLYQRLQAVLADIYPEYLDHLDSICLYAVGLNSS